MPLHSIWKLLLEGTVRIYTHMAPPYVAQFSFFVSGDILACAPLALQNVVSTNLEEYWNTLVHFCHFAHCTCLEA